MGMSENLIPALASPDVTINMVVTAVKNLDNFYPPSPYLTNFLYFTRFGSIESGPSRRTLSAS